MITVCWVNYSDRSFRYFQLDACGGIIEALNGTITSPSFPDIYPMSKECVWEIIAPEQYRITINFTHFDLEGNNYHQQECDYDSLSIYSKLDEDNVKKHGVFCGSRSLPLVTSEGNAMRIEFRSDNTIQKSGFAAVFFTGMMSEERRTLHRIVIIIPKSQLHLQILTNVLSTMADVCTNAKTL